MRDPIAALATKRSARKAKAEDHHHPRAGLRNPAHFDEDLAAQCRFEFAECRRIETKRARPRNDGSTVCARADANAVDLINTRRKCVGSGRIEIADIVYTVGRNVDDLTRRRNAISENLSGEVIDCS